jgi:hypothetical protein
MCIQARSYPLDSPVFLISGPDPEIVLGIIPVRIPIKLFIPQNLIYYIA